MKKIIRLTEQDLVRIVKQVIKESVTIDPYTLSVSGSNLKITNNQTKQSYTYRLEKKGWVNIDLTVKSITNAGLTVSGMGITRTAPLKTAQIKKLIQTNWGKSTLEYTTSDGDTIIFTRV